MMCVCCLQVREEKNELGDMVVYGGRAVLDVRVESVLVSVESTRLGIFPCLSLHHHRQTRHRIGSSAPSLLHHRYDSL